MFSTLAGMIMAAKIHFNQMKYPVEKRNDSKVSECIYQNKVKKFDEKEKYEKSLLPKSGYMTVAEYEAESKAKDKKDIKVEDGKIPKDSNMVYVPQKTFKLVKYNYPIGSPEINIPRRLNFDRQINAQGIISGDKSMLVYPAVYYYAQNDCTACDLFLIKLNSSLSDIEKVMKANIINKEVEPLISTSKDISEKFIFRTLTPIDFSSDNKKLVVKEKVGHRHDGIWKTDLWVYDFDKKEAIKLPQIRDAIVHYWVKAGGVDFDDKRWDIYPMGFDVNDNNRVIVCAYAYTGGYPKFLGTWSIDTEGTNSRLESIDSNDIQVSVVGYRLTEDSVKDISEVEYEAKQEKKYEEKEKKAARKADKEDKKAKKLEYQRKIHQMDMDTMLKIEQRKDAQKKINKQNKTSDYTTGVN